jgi:hypothetical protein
LVIGVKMMQAKTIMLTVPISIVIRSQFILNDAIRSG